MARLNALHWSCRGRNFWFAAWAAMMWGGSTVCNKKRGFSCSNKAAEQGSADMTLQMEPASQSQQKCLWPLVISL